ncbi:MAG: YfhO family protein [Chloroflexi bacterium]|nr:YfhO family protein [Chloroflexota bacterium]
MPERSLTRLPLLILALTLLVLFHRLLLGEVFFWGLPSLQFYPWRDYAFDLLRAGQLPLWNDLSGAGAPLFANYQSALLYPLSWPGFVLPLGSTMSVVAVLHLFIAGWGMWQLTGRMGLPPLGRALSAFAFALTSYLVARLGTYPVISTAVWLPWLLWALIGWLALGRLRSGALIGLFGALMLLGGHAQTAWYSLLLAGLFALWWTLRPHPIPDTEAASSSGGLRARRLITAGGLIALGAGVAALQLLATAELLSTSQRSAGVEFYFAMNFSYAPARTLNFLMPHIFGTPADGSFLTEGAYFEDAVYIGLIPLVSAFAAVIAWLRRRPDPDRPAYFAQTPFWLLIVVIGFVFALGRFTEIFPFLYNNIPTFDLFQAPVRWHLWTVFGLSLLAGIGAVEWRRSLRVRRRSRLVTLAAFAAAILAALALIFMADANVGLRIIAQAIIAAGLVGGAAGLLSLVQPERASRRYGLWVAGVLLLLSVDLGWANWGLNPTVPAAFYDQRTVSTDDSARAYWPAEIEAAVTFDEFFRFDDYRIATDDWQTVRASELPNLNILDGAALLNNFDPLLAGHHLTYLSLIENNPDAQDALYQASGVSAIYAGSATAEPLIHSVARAWLVESACWHTDEAALIEALTDPGWSPQQIVHLIGDGDCPAAESRRSAVGEVVAVQDDINQLTLQVDVNRAGWLVLADTDYPGWTVTVDGQPGVIERANLAFRAIALEPGTQTVIFDYQPGWLLPGALVSVMSLLVLLVLFRAGAVGRET